MNINITIPYYILFAFVSDAWIIALWIMAIIGWIVLDILTQKGQITVDYDS